MTVYDIDNRESINTRNGHLTVVIGLDDIIRQRAVQVLCNSGKRTTKHSTGFELLYKSDVHYTDTTLVELVPICYHQLTVSELLGATYLNSRKKPHCVGTVCEILELESSRSDKLVQISSHIMHIKIGIAYLLIRDRPQQLVIKSEILRNKSVILAKVTQLLEKVAESFNISVVLITDRNVNGLGNPYISIVSSTKLWVCSDYYTIATGVMCADNQNPVDYELYSIFRGEGFIPIATTMGAVVTNFATIPFLDPALTGHVDNILDDTKKDASDNILATLQSNTAISTAYRIVMKLFALNTLTDMQKLLTPIVLIIAYAAMLLVTYQDLANKAPLIPRFQPKAGIEKSGLTGSLATGIDYSEFLIYHHKAVIHWFSFLALANYQISKRSSDMLSRILIQNAGNILAVICGQLLFPFIAGFSASLAINLLGYVTMGYPVNDIKLWYWLLANVACIIVNNELSRLAFLVIRSDLLRDLIAMLYFLQNLVWSDCYATQTWLRYISPIRNITFDLNIILAGPDASSKNRNSLYVAAAVYLSLSAILYGIYVMRTQRSSSSKEFH